MAIAAERHNTRNAATTLLKVLGGVIVAVGIWSALVPYVGPTFGYPMPPGSDQSAWEWSASHTQRHLLPGIAAVIGGLLMWARTRSAVVGGALVALAAGIWMIINPFVVRAWLDGGGGGGGDASTVMQIITPLGYHYVPGMLTIIPASFALGWLLSRGRRRAEPAPASGRVERERFDHEPVVATGEREGARR